MTKADDELRDRIKKLFALSQSPNEHEAAAAAAKAQQLLTAHRLTVEDLKDAGEQFEHFDLLLDHPRPWHFTLALAVTLPNGCRIMTSPASDVVQILRFVGYPGVVFPVADLFLQLLPLVEAITETGWARHVEEATDPLYGVYPGVLDEVEEWKESFRTGVLVRLYDRLSEARVSAVEETSDRSSALIRLDKQDVAVTAYVNAISVAVEDRTPDHKTLKPSAFRAGHASGAALPLGARKRLPG